MRISCHFSELFRPLIFPSLYSTLSSYHAADPQSGVVVGAGVVLSKRDKRDKRFNKSDKRERCEHRLTRQQESGREERAEREE